MQTTSHFPGELSPLSPDAHHHPLFPNADLNERQVKSVPQPAARKPTDAEFYIQQPHGGGNLRPNPTFLRDHFFREGRLTDEQALFILREATALLSREPNMVEVKSPVTICGDIHGQYYDLMKLFEVGGGVSNNTYLFLGDYVDRGCFGMECLLLLYSLKLCYPNQFVLLRGNHECRHLTEYFTFKRECLRKYSAQVYEACIESFCSLPVSARVDNQFFCVHGGLSPELHTLDDLRGLNRFREPGSEGMLCDLLWSDPVADYGHENEVSPTNGAAGLPPGTHFVYNQMRGCSFNFTYEAACNFLDRNDLLGIIRGHEAQDAGYQMHRKSPSHRFPSVITVFSAPNYCDAYHNRGAVLKYHNKNVTIRQFNSSPHPYWLPNFMDAFTWSLPFVGSKITEMLLAILSICSQEELEDEDADSDEDKSVAETVSSPTDVAARRQAIRNKILAVGKMQRVFQILREESEAQSELTEGGVQLGSDALGVQTGKSIRNFHDARQSDMLNERLPTFRPDDNNALMFPTPSMRIAGQTHGTQGDSGINMDYLIRRTLEDGYDDGGVVEELADRIARGRKATGRPTALKRFDTT